MTRSAGLAMLGILAALLPAAHPAAAQAQRTTAKEPPVTAAARQVAARFAPTAWQVQCVAGEGGAVKCVLGRAVLETRTRRILVRVQIPDDRRSLTLQLPHGLDLRRPVEVLVNGKALGRAAFITSRPAGAFAQMPLKGRLLDTLRKGKTLSVKMTIFNGRDMTVRMDLKGFAAALAKLR